MASRRNEEQDGKALARRNFAMALGGIASVSLLDACAGRDGIPKREVVATSADALLSSRGVEDYAELRGLAAGAYDYVFVRRYDGSKADYAAAGLFYWDADHNYSDNDGTIITPGGASGSGCWRRVFNGPLNVRWFGARGDGVTADDSAIQHALDEVRLNGGSLWFPSGRYVVSTTLDAGDSEGIRYAGDGATPRATASDQADGNYPQHPSRLVWTGAAQGTLFKWSGSHCVFENLAFYGSFDGATSRAGVGFQISKVSGLGTGKGKFHNVFIRNCDVGLRCADQETDGNCDCLTFTNLDVSCCSTGFQVNNNQGQIYTFVHVSMAEVETCFDFEYGGRLDVTSFQGGNLGTNGSPTVPFRVLQIGAGGSRIGYYRIRSVELDEQQYGPAILVSRPSGALGQAHVEIDGGSIFGLANADSTVPPFQITNFTQLIVRNMAGLTTPVVDMSSNVSYSNCSAIFEHCSIDMSGAVLQISGSAGNYWWATRACCGPFSPSAFPPLADDGNLP